VHTARPMPKQRELPRRYRINRRPSLIVRRRRALVGLVLAVAALLAGSRLAADLFSGGGQALDPSAFSSGACMSYPPTNGDRGETVFLDAGHGGIDPGGVGSTEGGQSVSEAEVNLPIELGTMRLLRADGFGVAVSRTLDSSVVKLSHDEVAGGVLSLQGAHDDVAARDVCANLAGAKALVGIYMNASSSPAIGGSLSAYDAARSFSRANLRLAGLLQRDVLSAMNAQGWNIPSRGVISDASAGSYIPSATNSELAAKAAAYDHLLLLGPAMPGYFATPSTMPGAVIEPLYVTDPFEGSVAVSRHGQQVIATGIAHAVEQFLGQPAR
jgi:N-acetylmuramoyl-L-alanine amidase